jgi:hypothetical protein
MIFSSSTLKWNYHCKTNTFSALCTNNTQSGHCTPKLYMNRHYSMSHVMFCPPLSDTARSVTGYLALQ